MLATILGLFRFVRLLGSGHQAVAIENLALRLQLAAYKRKPKRPVLTQWGRSGYVEVEHLATAVLHDQEHEQRHPAG
jgi:hypothetical protein